MIQRAITVKGFNISNELPITLIAGPCVIESVEHALDMSGKLKDISIKFGIPFIYKTSFDKANRTSRDGFRGANLDKSLYAFEAIKKWNSVPIITDVHKEEQCEFISKFVDVLQIPAFLCRQTDLLVAAAKTGIPINVKKGQFLSPQEMEHVVNKMWPHTHNVMLCERGTSFGYNTLINDMTALPIMARLGLPVIFDATHSVQKPGAGNGCTLGNRDMVPYLARAAVAVGVAGVFMETHEDPDNAPSDGPNMVKLSKLPEIIEQIMEIDFLTKKYLKDSTNHETINYDVV